MKKLVSLLAVAATMLLATTVMATPFADITYDYTKSGNTYTFDLTVKNTSTTDKLDFFLINLDRDPTTAVYSNILWNVGKGWSTVAVQDDTAFGGLPGTVIADDSFLGGNGGGIATGGASLSGFKFSFDYTGSVVPTDQTFSYLASFGTASDGYVGYFTAFDETGYIRYFHPDTGGNTVPEPGTVLLLGAGIAGLALYRRKRNS